MPTVHSIISMRPFHWRHKAITSGCKWTERGLWWKAVVAAVANKFTFKLKLMDPLAQMKCYFIMYFHNSLLWRESRFYLANTADRLQASTTGIIQKKLKMFPTHYSQTEEQAHSQESSRRVDLSLVRFTHIKSQNCFF